MSEDPKGFEILGKNYAVPTLDTFDIGDARILKRYSGAVMEDFRPFHPEASQDERDEWLDKQQSLLFDPEVKAAFAHVAYRRGNPEKTFDEIEAVIEKLNLVHVTLALFEEEESPPELSSQSEPENESNTKTLSALTDSGRPSQSTSGELAESQRPTGTGESGTSSPVSLVGT